MTTTEPSRRAGRPIPPTAAAPALAKHSGVWVAHNVFAFFVLPVFIGPGVVAALANIQLTAATGSGWALLLLGFLVGAAIGVVIGPRKRLFAPRPKVATGRVGRR